jgi:DNA-binding SARP family transcriptional activator/tetratricopeptide (TPR) repeat protein
VTAGVRLFVFGGFRLENASGEVLSMSLRKAEALLAYLAMAPGKTASREKLATLLWGESDQQRARQSLRQALFALTREFAQAEVSVLRMESQMVSLDPAAIWVDVAEFQALVATADSDRLTEAFALYSGPFLQGFTVDSAEFDEWQMALQGRLDEAAIKAFLDLIDRQEAAGDLASAIETAQGALRIDHYREDVHRQLMRLFVASGMRSSALHQYRLCRDFLERELGVPPDAETTVLYRDILEAGPAAAPDLEPAAEAGLASLRTPDRDRNRSVATVGRTAELHELERHLQAAREGRGGLVLVTGEAGVGKSRLIDDFAALLAERDAVCALARGHRAERARSLGLWSDLLGETAMAADGRRDKGLSPEAVDRLARFRAVGLRDVDEAGAQVRAGLYEDVVELIHARSAHRPLVLVFDDLHWADQHSLELIDCAVRRLNGAPVLFVATWSAGEFGQDRLPERLRDLESTALLSQLELRPLSREETGALVRGLQQADSGREDAALEVDEVWALSEGNPRIAVEMVMQDAKGAGLKMPRHFVSELSRTMAALSEPVRELANLASVMGSPIDYDVLRHCARLDAEALVHSVESLVAAKIFVSVGDSLVFARERIRSVLYEGLLPQRRETLHATIARAIEEVHAGVIEPHLDPLARHWHQAGDAAKGFQCELAAASVERRCGAHGAARKRYQQTLRAVQELKGLDRAQALEAAARFGLGLIAEAERDLDTAWTIFGDLETHLHRIQDPRQRVAALLALSRVHVLRKDRDRGYEYAGRALAEAERVGADSVWPPADCLLIRIHLIANALGETIDRLAQQRDRAERLRLHEDEADAAAAIGILHAVRGDFAAAQTHCRGAVDVAERLGNERCLSAALQVRGMVGMWCGALDEALADFDKARKIAEEGGDLLRSYLVIGHRGFALAAARRYDEAMAEFKLALSMAARLNTKIFRPLFTAWLAEACFESGQHEEALRAAREASQLAAEQNQPWARSVALRALARVLAHPEVRDLNGAERSIRTALADQEGLGIKFETARSMIVQAKIMRSAGNTRQSSAVYDRASKMFQQMQMAGEFDSARNMAEALRPGGE